MNAPWERYRNITGCEPSANVELALKIWEASKMPIERVRRSSSLFVGLHLIGRWRPAKQFAHKEIPLPPPKVGTPLCQYE